MRNIILLLCFYFIEFLLELINHFTCSIELCYGKYLKYIHFMKNFVFAHNLQIFTDYLREREFVDLNILEI